MEQALAGGAVRAISDYVIFEMAIATFLGLAAGRQIRVCVLEGHYVELADAGTPISVCLQMQQLELSLGKAQWSTRQTCGGFSVSFFWPTSPAKSARTSIKKRKRRRKRTKRTEVGTQCLAANLDAPMCGGLPSSEHVLQ